MGLCYPPGVGWMHSNSAAHLELELPVWKLRNPAVFCAAGGQELPSVSRDASLELESAGVGSEMWVMMLLVWWYRSQLGLT